jgi:hypothetical protein
MVKKLAAPLPGGSQTGVYCGISWRSALGAARAFWSGFWDGVSMRGLMFRLSLPQSEEVPLFEPEPDAQEDSEIPNTFRVQGDGTLRAVNRVVDELTGDDIRGNLNQPVMRRPPPVDLRDVGSIERLSPNDQATVLSFLSNPRQEEVHKVVEILAAVPA